MAENAIYLDLDENNIVVDIIVHNPDDPAPHLAQGHTFRARGEMVAGIGSHIGDGDVVTLPSQ